MGLPISVGQNAIKVSGTAVSPYLLTNDAGSYNTVYLGQNSAVSTSNYSLTLQPGASIVWTELNNEVWAVTDTGGAANLVVAYEAGGTFVPSSFGANATLLKTTAIPFTTSQNVITGTIADIYVGNYASVMVMVSTNITSATTFQTDLTKSWTYADGVQYDGAYRGSNTTLFSRTNSAAWTFGNGNSQTTGLAQSIQTYTFPVTNGFFAYNYGIVKDQTLTATSGAGTVTFRVYGINTSTASETYVNWTPVTPLTTKTSTSGTLTKTEPTQITTPNQEVIVNTTSNGTFTTKGFLLNNNPQPWGATFVDTVPTVTGASNWYFSFTYSFTGALVFTNGIYSLNLNTYRLAGQTTGTPLAFPLASGAISSGAISGNGSFILGNYPIQLSLTLSGTVAATNATDSLIFSNLYLNAY